MFMKAKLPAKTAAAGTAVVPPDTRTVASSVSHPETLLSKDAVRSPASYRGPKYLRALPNQAASKRPYPNAADTPSRLRR